jgi:hypothetical protein
MAAQSGLGSLIAFVVLIGGLLRNTARAVGRAMGAEQQLLLTLCFLPAAGFLIGGFFEPTFINSTKLNHVFWLFVGSTACNRLADASTRVSSAPGRPAIGRGTWCLTEDSAPGSPACGSRGRVWRDSATARRTCARAPQCCLADPLRAASIRPCCSRCGLPANTRPALHDTIAIGPFFFDQAAQGS